MKRTIEFVAEIDPVPQPRQRHSGRVSYIPDRHAINAVKSAIRAAAARALRGRPPIPAGSAMVVEFLFVFRRLKSHPRSRVRTPHTMETADADNLQKGVQDALIKVAYERDGAIWKWSGQKVIGADGEPPSIKIVIRW